MVTLSLLNSSPQLIFSDGIIHSINLDLNALQQKYFHILPPSDAQWEYAIMEVEDAIAPWVQERPSEKNLQLCVSDILSNLLGNIENISSDVVEQMFQKLSRYGNIAKLETMPSEMQSEIYVNLLVLREFLHHMDFSEVKLIKENS